MNVFKRDKAFLTWNHFNIFIEIYYVYFINDSVRAGAFLQCECIWWAATRVWVDCRRQWSNGMVGASYEFKHILFIKYDNFRIIIVPTMYSAAEQKHIFCSPCDVFHFVSSFFFRLTRAASFSHFIIIIAVFVAAAHYRSICMVGANWHSFIFSKLILKRCWARFWRICSVICFPLSFCLDIS